MSGVRDEAMAIVVSDNRGGAGKLVVQRLMSRRGVLCGGGIGSRVVGLAGFGGRWRGRSLRRRGAILADLQVAPQAGIDAAKSCASRETKPKVRPTGTAPNSASPGTQGGGPRLRLVETFKVSRVRFVEKLEDIVGCTCRRRACLVLCCAEEPGTGTAALGFAAQEGTGGN
ncbi:MAG: hypothetical protein IPJ52_00705 [Rhodocyclaceae bacterium]|nr:hypothetical protein [Rhodocyclaceae bacterium]